MSKDSRTKTERKYYIQHFNKPKWLDCRKMKGVQEVFGSPEHAKQMMDKVMTHFNDFVPMNYRLVERTTIVIDEPLEKFGKGW